MPCTGGAKRRLVQGNLKETMINIEEQIKVLIELQGLDSQIFKLEDDLGAIPVKIKEMDDHFKSNTGSLKSAEDALKSLQVKRKDKEGELEAKESSVKKFQTQMYQVKTNKEYAAFQGEIGRAKADGEIIEEDIIRILDQIDAANKNILKEKEALKGEESLLIKEKERLNQDADRVKSELSDLKSKRDILAQKVDKDILAKYDRIVKSQDGLAVVPILNESSCQGCFRILPSQVINEVKMKDKLVFCDSCSRILYIEE
jgi:predicted  nucleic acid-binding Zn-ribbon protein